MPAHAPHCHSQPPTKIGGAGWERHSFCRHLRTRYAISRAPNSLRLGRHLLENALRLSANGLSRPAPLPLGDGPLCSQHQCLSGPLDRPSPEPGSERLGSSIGDFCQASWVARVNMRAEPGAVTNDRRCFAR